MSYSKKKKKKKNENGELKHLQILENCVTPLGNSKIEKQDTWKFHILNDPTVWIFNPQFRFFWNIPMSHITERNLFI